MAEDRFAAGRTDGRRLGGSWKPLALLLTAAAGILVTMYSAHAQRQPAAATATATGTAASSTRPAGNLRPFSVASFNVLYTNPDLGKMVEVIKLADADLVALQETNAQSVAAIKKHLGKAYPHSHFTYAQAAGGLGLISRSPLKNIKLLPPHKEAWFGTLMADVELGGQTVRVASVHLFPNLVGRGQGLAGVLTAFQKNEAIRRKEIEAICAQLPKGKPVILMGDFNCFSSSSAPAYLAGKGFVDSAGTGAAADKATTWKGDWGGQTYTFRIDYVFHTSDMTTTRSAVIPSGQASDHDLVLARLKWKPAPATATATATATAP